MTDQSTNDDGNTEQDNGVEIFLYAKHPLRSKEVEQIKRLRLVGRVWTILYLVALVIGLLLLTLLSTTHILSTPLQLSLTALWCISILGTAGMWNATLRRKEINTDHYWQDKRDAEWLDLREKVFDPMRAMGKKADQINQLTGPALDRLLAISNEMKTPEPTRRGPGRPEITVEEASKWIDKANQAAADLLVKNERRPTREAIAQAIHMTVSTLGRYEKIAGRKVSINK